MQRIELLNRIFRTAPHISEEITLFPVNSNGSLSDMCSDGDHDLSYEDALVDTQARLFFRSELGREVPTQPSLAFASLLERLEETAPATSIAAVDPVSVAERQENSAERGTGTRGRLKRGLSGSLVSRLVPSTVALLLVVMALGTDLASYLRPEGRPDGMRTFGESGSGSSLTVQQELDLLRRPSRPIVVTTSLVSVPSSAAMIHPVEMGMKPNERDAWAQAAPHAFTSYERGKFGPE
jgi:hypothetical protein